MGDHENPRIADQTGTRLDAESARRSSKGKETGINTIYEREDLLAQYLIFHYGSAEVRMPWMNGPRIEQSFPESCVQTLLEAGLKRGSRALDIGCAVGGAAMALSRTCATVVGVDSSVSFIEAANAMRRDRHIRILPEGRGHLAEPVDIALDPEANEERVEFHLGDAHFLPTEWKDFDAVLACNLICRLSNPIRFLSQLPRLVRNGGLLLITTPNTWLESFTAREFWLVDSSVDSRSSVNVIRDHLKEHFELLKRVDIPFCIREHSRKFQWSVAEATVWRRLPKR